MRPYLFVGFLILSAGFLILLAGALIVSADAIRIFAFRKVELLTLSILWKVLWLSWEEKSKKIIDIFKPTNFQKGAPSTSPIRGSAQLWFSDQSDWSDLSENPKQVVAEHSPSWGRWRGLPIKPYSLFHQYFLAIADIHTYG